MAGKKNSAPAKPSGKRGASKPTTNSSRTTTTKELEISKSEEEEEEEEETKRQQTLLNIFSTTFRDVLGAPDFSAQLQEVKAALFARDFEGAFAREAALDVYAARWSPTRALCYGQVLRGLDSYLSSLIEVERNSACEGGSLGRDAGDDDDLRREGQNGSETRGPSAHGDVDKDIVKDEAGNADADADASPDEPAATPGQQNAEDERGENAQVLKILAIGGAAAEIVAFADYISSHNPGASSSISPRRAAQITLLDVGPWGTVVSRLHTALTTTPPISRYASAAARAANKPLLSPSCFTSTFLQKDVLSLDAEELSRLIRAGEDADQDEDEKGTDEETKKIPILITLLFTLNELYTTSGIKRTTSFLRLLSSLAAPGTLLLVIDSPGSYSEAAVGKEAKRYPMQWLLDHTLLSPPSSKGVRGKKAKEKSEAEGEAEAETDPKPEGRGVGEPEPRWEKIESNDSVWFRVADGLRYPIPLENMRYQMHLYRACGS